jgi:hypothetical protein
MERKRIYCSRRSAVSESNNVIEALKFEGMYGSPKLMKLGTGSIRFFSEMYSLS